MMMQSFPLSFLARSVFLGALVGTVLTRFYGAEGAAIAAQPQIPSALTTINSSHWAFQSLKSLAEQYGCLINSSDRYFQPSATPSRYEMAAALNACLDQIADHLTPKDYVMAQALLKEFKPEMDVLRSRVPQDCRAATLESQQFSTPPIIHGEVVMGSKSSQKDLETAQALQKEFNPELAALKDRSDFLKNHTEALKFNQFSTTTKFQGQAIITIQGGGFR